MVGHPEPVESSETHTLCPSPLVASVGAERLSPKNVWQRWPLTVTTSLYCITLYHTVSPGLAISLHCSSIPLEGLRRSWSQ